MPRGRKRRLKNFVQRAMAFAKDVEKDSGFKFLQRDGRIVLVGEGKHKRLVSKFNSLRNHIGRAKIQQDNLANFLKLNKTTPKYYALVKVASSPEMRVQEYFHRPSLRSLMDFIKIRNGRQLRVPVKKADALLCKQFLNKYKGTTLRRADAAKNEIFRHLTKIKEPFQIESNIIVVGKTRDGRLRLAIVDV